MGLPKDDAKADKEQKPPARKRFEIHKLEERIAPKNPHYNPHGKLVGYKGNGNGGGCGGYWGYCW